MFKAIVKLYHFVLKLFFDYDIGVYAYKTPKIPAKKIENYKYNKPVRVKNFTIPQIDLHNYKYQDPKLKTYSPASLLSMIKIKNANKEFESYIKIKYENMDFLSIPKNYNLNLIDELNISNEPFILGVNSHKSLLEEIQISRNLKTIEELLELEPYTNTFPKKEVAKIPVTKYPVKPERFSELQLENMKTKLAIQAKCKKYSIVLDNIYDKIPKGLYSEIELNKDNTLSCVLDENPEIGELYLLVTGKRKYDTQIIKTLIKYSELGIKN